MTWRSLQRCIAPACKLQLTLLSNSAFVTMTDCQPACRWGSHSQLPQSWCVGQADRTSWNAVSRCRSAHRFGTTCMQDMHLCLWRSGFCLHHHRHGLSNDAWLSLHGACGWISHSLGQGKLVLHNVLEGVGMSAECAW